MNDLEKLKNEITKIKWYHQIDLGNGIITNGKSNNVIVLKNMKLDHDLTGKTVLDVGAWDGFFSFEAERRGAKRILAIDSHSWNGSGWGSKEGFNLARRILNSKVEDMEIDVLDITPNKIGKFDIVFFIRVLYHMIDPLLALKKIVSVTEEKVILETLVDMLGTNRPAMAFYPNSEINNDPTNWWAPNPQAVTAMLKYVGFKKIEMVYQTPLIRRIGGAILGRNKTPFRFLENVKMARAVFHAWK